MTDKLSSYKYYPFLDGLRALAVIWVLFHHMNMFFDLSKIFYQFRRPIYYFCTVGYLGVDIFFVISGFLITGLLVKDLDQNLHVRRFYARRFFKIIPHYLLALFVGLFILNRIEPFQFPFMFSAFNLDGQRIHVYATFVSHAPRATIYQYFIFLQNYINPAVTILGHFWSLAIEAHFYLFYPIIIKIICLFTKQRSTKKLTLIVVVVCLIILVNYYRWIMMSKFHYAPFQTTLYRIDALMFGCLLRLLEPNIEEIAHKIGHKLSITLTSIGIAIFSWFVFHGFNQGLWYSYTLAYLASGCFIISGFHSRSLLNKVLCRKSLIYIGKQSYGIYLWNYIIAFSVVGLLPKLGVVESVLLYLFASIMVGTLLTQTYEKYFLNLRERLIKKENSGLAPKLV